MTTAAYALPPHVALGPTLETERLILRPPAVEDFPRWAEFMADPEIKILVLASAGGGRSAGPLVSAVLKHGAAFTGRKLPVTIVPGELTEKEIEDLA